jgi:hypothetical protein
MPLTGKYKQGDLGMENEAQLSREKMENWVNTKYSHAQESSVNEKSLSGKNQVDSGFNALADKKDY